MQISNLKMTIQNAKLFLRAKHKDHPSPTLILPLPEGGGGFGEDPLNFLPSLWEGED